MHQEELRINPNNIFLKIWTSPREAFRFINNNHHQKYVNLLLMVSAIATAFEKSAKKNDLENLFSSGPRIGLIILSGMVVYISYYISASLISWTGKWIDGKGDTKSILRMLSYAMIPSIIGFVILIPVIAIYGINVLNSKNEVTNLDRNFPLFYTIESLEAILSIWTLVLIVIGLSEVQKFSIWKAIQNLIVPVIFLVSILVIVVSLFTYIY